MENLVLPFPRIDPPKTPPPPVPFSSEMAWLKLEEIFLLSIIIAFCYLDLFLVRINSPSFKPSFIALFEVNPCAEWKRDIVRNKECYENGCSISILVLSEDSQPTGCPRIIIITWIRLISCSWRWFFLRSVEKSFFIRIMSLNCASCSFPSSCSFSR